MSKHRDDELHQKMIDRYGKRVLTNKEIADAFAKAKEIVEDSIRKKDDLISEISEKVKRRKGGSNI